MVHRYWDGPPAPLATWTGKVLEHTQHLAVHDWTPETLPPDLAALLEREDPRHDSNVIRYALLHRYGGLWCDHDVVALQRFPQQATAWTAGLLGQREGAVLWFPVPNHPMMAQALQGALDAAPGPSPQRSGARLLTSVGRAHPGVGIEPRVLPLGADGRPYGHGEPLAVHLWSTSSERSA